MSSPSYQQTQGPAAPPQNNPPVDPAKARAADSNSPAAIDEKKTPTVKEEISAPRIPQNDKIVIGTGLVNVTVSVTDNYGRFVTGLSKEHFEVFDDKVKQQIAHFSDDDAPVSLGIVYDVSGSMKERIGRSLKALRRFIETSHDDDDVFLIGFNDRARLVQDFTTSGDQVL
ncbi:MAG TPA: VWA domain-containing protein, partial [Blastocatellia bacterium]|nr:VWA domain-containing protein [Blastocatellia bacterium]